MHLIGYSFVNFSKFTSALFRTRCGLLVNVPA
jgi:hypothetical protein